MALVDALTEWAAAQPWIDWLELGGSLGRGAGDELSDIDAGIGVTGSLDESIELVESAVAGLAPVAGRLRQAWPDGAHVIAVYADGRQLSLVVQPAESRSGLAPQARALVDKSGRLALPLSPERWAPDQETLREWAFLGWIAVGDAARHAHRGHPWRALKSLTEARDRAWQLWAARQGLTFPQFGEITVENAVAPLPPDIEATHPARLDREQLIAAARVLADVLEPLSPPDVVDGPAVVIRRRVDALRSIPDRGGVAAPAND